MIGKTILHYKILKKLGEGGMGVVYLAEDLNLEREVAIKFLPQHIASNREERERFKIEAKAAAALNHPNIATIHSIEESEDQIFIVMEFIDGIELKEKIRSGPLAVDEITKIAVQIAESLTEAHKKGIVHRDIKSQNIMITDDGKVKVMDFGLAKVGQGAQLTRPGSTIGTAAYMSPEQAKGNEADNRSDIWSFGVVLYEMLAGELPFSGDYDQAVIYSILNEKPAYIPGVNRKLQYIVERMLKKDPDDRYNDVGQILNDLNKSGNNKSHSSQRRRISKWIFVISVLIAILIVAYFFIPFTGAGGKEKIESIAVLPFADMSPNKDQEYFSDGLSEELLNVLAQNPKLRVTSRTSAFSFKNSDIGLEAIASKLNVDHILEGSVRKAGNQIRISAELIDVNTDALLWSETFDGVLNNIFSLQDSISHSVAEALNVKLLGDKNVNIQYQADPEVYSLYLQAEHLGRQYNRKSWEKAEDYYEQVLRRDSAYAPAWVGLSWIHMYQANNAFISFDSGYHKARQEAETALRLNPEWPRVYDALGTIERNYAWNWTAAYAAYQKGLELAPENVDVILGAAAMAATLGRFEESIKLNRRAIELDPVNAIARYSFAFDALRAGILNASVKASRKSLELNPQFQGAHMLAGLALLVAGKPDSALIEINKEKSDFWRMFGLTLTKTALNQKKEADKMLHTIINDYSDDAGFQIAQIYSYRDQADSAIIWLNRAFDHKDPGLADIEGDPFLKNIDDDPRYIAFMKKMNLPL